MFTLIESDQRGTFEYQTNIIWNIWWLVSALNIYCQCEGDLKCCKFTFYLFPLNIKLNWVNPKVILFYSFGVFLNVLLSDIVSQEKFNFILFRHEVTLDHFPQSYHLQKQSENWVLLMTPREWLYYDIHFPEMQRTCFRFVWLVLFFHSMFFSPSLVQNAAFLLWNKFKDV